MNELNFFENKKFPRTRNLIPHNSKLNNYKSNKYFTIEENTNLMKEALTKYRETQKFEKNNSINTNNNCNNTNNNIIIAIIQIKVFIQLDPLLI